MPFLNKAMLSDTLIQMSDGSFKKAGDLEVGDILFSYSMLNMPDESDSDWRTWTIDDPFTNGEVTTSTVVNIRKITVEEDIYILNQKIELTASQPIFAYQDQIGAWKWKSPSLLYNGNLLFKKDGSSEEITLIEVQKRNTELVELDVEDVDNFFASEHGYLLHNNQLEEIVDGGGGGTTTYTITWNPNGGTWSDNSSTLSRTTTVNAQATPTQPAGISRSGFTFINWSPTIVAATSSVAYTAQWNPIGRIFIGNVDITTTKSYNRFETTNNELAYIKGIQKIDFSDQISYGDYEINKRYRVGFASSGDNPSNLASIGGSNQLGFEFTATGTGQGLSGSSYSYEIKELVNSQNFYTRYASRNNAQYSDISRASMPVFIGTEQVEYINPNTIVKPILRYEILGPTSSITFNSTTIRNLFANTNDSDTPTTTQRAVVVFQGGGGGGAGGNTQVGGNDGGGGGGGAFAICHGFQFKNDERHSFEISSGGAGGAIGASGVSGQTASATIQQGSDPPNSSINAIGGAGGRSPALSGVGGAGGSVSALSVGGFGSGTATLLAYGTNATFTSTTSSFATDVSSGAAGGTSGSAGSGITNITTTFFTGNYFGRLTRSTFTSTTNSLFYGSITGYASGGPATGGNGGGGGASRFAQGGAGGTSVAGGTGGVGSGGGGGDSRSGAFGGGTVGGNGGSAFIQVYL
jgi:hypothetical protein